MNAKEMRKYYIECVNFVNEIAEDIKANGCTDEVIEYAEGFAHLENEYDDFWRVSWGGAYAYVDIDENGNPLDNEISWLNDEMGCDSTTYTETIRELKAMTDEEILNTEIADCLYDTDYDECTPLEYIAFK